MIKKLIILTIKLIDRILIIFFVICFIFIMICL